MTVSCATGARVERQRQAPVALAADVPVAHVVEPVVHALASDGGTQLTVSEAAFILGRISSAAMNHSSASRNGKLLAAAPAGRVAVRVVLRPVEHALRVQAVEDGRVRLADVAPAQARRSRRRRSPASSIGAMTWQAVRSSRARSPRRRSRARCGRRRCPLPRRHPPRRSRGARCRPARPSSSNGPRERAGPTQIASRDSRATSS